MTPQKEICSHCHDTGIVEKNIPAGENSLEMDVELFCDECEKGERMFYDIFSRLMPGWVAPYSTTLK